MQTTLVVVFVVVVIAATKSKEKHLLISGVSYNVLKETREIRNTPSPTRVMLQCAQRAPRTSARADLGGLLPRFGDEIVRALVCLADHPVGSVVGLLLQPIRHGLSSNLRDRVRRAC